jgi:hypothetical protein
MHKVLPSPLRLQLFAAAAGIGLLLSSTPVHAEPIGPDSLSIFCGGLRVRAQQLINEYGQTPADSPRRGAILTELRQIGSDWKDICQGTFGTIFLQLPAGLSQVSTVPLQTATATITR